MCRSVGFTRHSVNNTNLCRCSVDAGCNRADGDGFLMSSTKQIPLQEILGVVQFVGRELVTVISVVPRLRKESPSAADIEVHEEHGQAPVLTGFHPNRMPNFYEVGRLGLEATLRVNPPHQKTSVLQAG